MILVDALYINNSGGRVLLDELVAAFEASSLEVFYLFDARCKGSYNEVPASRKIFLSSGIRNRKKFYTELKIQPDKILCFGNIPPPLKQKAVVYTYFHNVNLLEIPPGMNFKQKVRLLLKRLYIAGDKKNTNYFLVQSDFVKSLLNKKLKFPLSEIQVLPFYKTMLKPLSMSEKNDNDFVYISNGNAHKNHIILLEAWQKLADNGLYPMLHLTVTDEYPALQHLIEFYVGKGLCIINHGYTDPWKLYAKARYCIYPSLAESFGLGLIESAQAGCGIIAADLPYVKAVVEPLDVFNPRSADSIAECVRRNLSSEAQWKASPVKVENKMPDLIMLLSK